MDKKRLPSKNSLITFTGPKPQVKSHNNNRKASDGIAGGRKEREAGSTNGAVPRFPSTNRESNRKGKSEAPGTREVKEPLAQTKEMRSVPENQQDSGNPSTSDRKAMDKFRERFADYKPYQAFAGVPATVTSERVINANLANIREKLAKIEGKLAKHDSGERKLEPPSVDALMDLRATLRRKMDNLQGGGVSDKTKNVSLAEKRLAHHKKERLDLCSEIEKVQRQVEGTDGEQKLALYRAKLERLKGREKKLLRQIDKLETSKKNCSQLKEKRTEEGKRKNSSPFTQRQKPIITMQSLDEMELRKLRKKLASRTDQLQLAADLEDPVQRAAKTKKLEAEILELNSKINEVNAKVVNKRFKNFSPKIEKGDRELLGGHFEAVQKGYEQVRSGLLEAQKVKQGLGGNAVLAAYADAEEGYKKVLSGFRQAIEEAKLVKQ